MNFIEHIQIRQEKFGTVIFDTMREKVFVTNETGAEVLRLIEEGKEMNELTGLLENFYSANPDLIASDIRSFVQELKEKGLVRDDGRG